ncbi:glycerate kinase [Enterococcus sp. LJL51]|uniref:glycerate kinase family protein n=1 Tax=Enterococcus sp. LJL51 TaxID=3416656 RepID=UPI003CF875E2
MNVTIAIDSFKECATSTELGKAIERGIQPFANPVHVIPISDGGEGAIESVAAAFDGQYIKFDSLNPFGEAIQEDYFLTTIEGIETAVIESARFVGIHFLKGRKEESYLGSSYGLGLAVSDAVSRGVKQLIVTLGGSGTTDGGLGMLQGLGARLFDAAGQLLAAGCENPLLVTHQLEIEKAKQRLAGVKLIVANDVANPYCGRKGAARIFGPQKGLTAAQIEQLDTQLYLTAEYLVQNGFADLRLIAGAGAAGGLGGAFALLDGEMQPGFSIFSKLTRLEEHIAKSDWVITGEGCLDTQSSAGKVPYGVAQLAAKYHTSVLLLCGSYEEIPEQALFDGIFSIQREPVSLQQAMDRDYTLKNIEMISHELFKMLAKKK